MESVKEANAMLRKIRDGNSDVWKGDAGNAFRANFDANLGQDLAYAQNSLERAVSVLGGWKALNLP